jgi:hypothetical protein
MPITADLLLLQAKTAVLEELYRRYDEVRAAEDWQSALYAIEPIMLCVAGVLQEAHTVLEKLSALDAHEE